MKKYVMYLILCLCSFSAQAQKISFTDGVVKEIVTDSTKSVSEKTEFVYENKKGERFPIYISKSGATFILVTSKKSGKEYRKYLGKEISMTICEALGRPYKSAK